MKKNLFFILFLAIGLTSCNSAIESPQKVKDFIQGKWHNETVSRGGLITYYRFEITQTEIRCWKSNLFLSDNGVSSDNVETEWVEQTPVSLSIGNIEVETVGNPEYDKQFRLLGYCDYGTYKFQNSSNNGDELTFKDNDGSGSEFDTGKLYRGWEY